MISILTGSVLFIRHASAGISVWRLAPRPADESDPDAPALDELRRRAWRQGHVGLTASALPRAKEHAMQHPQSA